MLLDDMESRPLPTVAQLEALHRRCRGDRNFTRTAAEAAVGGSPGLERSGAWLVRREAAERAGYPAEDWEVVIEGLGGVRSWAGRLILCQLFSEQPALMDTAPVDVAVFLRDCARHPRPTVRAWAVTSFHELGRRNPVFRAEARRLVAAARRDPAKCMQARLRHLAR
jgi:hypothetical protein